MIPEEQEHGSWGWMREPESWRHAGHYWCDVCGKSDTYEHEVVEERDIAGTVVLSYCTETGAVIDASAKRDITQAELDYVKQSLGVVNG